MHFYFHSVFVDGNLNVAVIEYEFFSIPLYRIEELKIKTNLLFKKKEKKTTYVDVHNQNHFAFVL